MRQDQRFAAKGAEPLGVLLGHMLGPGDDRFVAGLAEVLAHYDMPLLGGDTTSGKGTRSHGLTALGRATFTPVPSRSTAQPGDRVWVTGTLGAAMVGFEALRDGTGGDHSAYSRPRALVAEGRKGIPDVLPGQAGVVADTVHPAGRPAQVFDKLPRQSERQIESPHPGQVGIVGQPGGPVVQGLEAVLALQNHPATIHMAHRMHDGLAARRSAAEITSQQGGQGGSEIDGAETHAKPRPGMETQYRSLRRGR